MTKKQKKRQPKGSGSIRKLKKGKYEVRYDFGKKPDGSRNSVSRTASDINEAHKMLEELRALANLETDIDTETPLYYAVKIHYETFRKPNLGESSIQIYDSLLENYIKPSKFAGLAINKISDTHIQMILNEIGKTKGKETVKRIKSLVAGPLKRAHDKGVLRVNPLAGVKILGAASTERKEKAMWLSEDEQHRIIEYCYNESRPRFMTMAAMALTALGTGLRIGEICALRDEDVNLDLQLVRVRQSIKRRNKGLKASIPKTETSIRDVQIIYFAIPIMKRYLDFRNNELAQNDLYEPSGLFFTTPFGGPIDPRNATKGLKRIFRELEFTDAEKMGFHELRHTYGTRMLEAGVNPKTVQELMGHSDVSITLGVYSHVSVKTKEAATKKVSDLYPLPEGIAK